MPSVEPISQTHDFSTNSPAAQQKVDAAALDSQLSLVKAKLNELLVDLGLVIRDDDTLVDELVRLRNLHPEINAVLASSAGWQPKVAVAVASTANLALTGEQTIDGVLTAASRVLVKNQATASQNGIYVTAAGAWTRATDADAASELGLAAVSVTGGDTQSGTAWVVIEAASAITLGTTSITWAQFGGPTASALRVKPTGTTTSRPLADHLAHVYSVKDFNAKGDNVTDDTAAITAAIAAAILIGGTVYFPTGTYLTDMQTIAGACSVAIAPGATVKQRNAATETASMKAVFKITASGVRIDCQGWIDANRAGQDKAAFNAAGGSAAKAWYGVHLSGTSGAPLTDIDMRLRVKNAMDYGVSASYLKGRFDVVVKDSGAGFALIGCTSDCQIPLLVLQNLDNDGAKIYPHAFDMNSCTGVKVGTVHCTQQGTDDNTGAGTSLSDWFSGVTFIDVEDVSIESIHLESRADATLSKSVGISLLSCRRMRLGAVSIIGYTDNAFEIGGVEDSDFANVLVDGRFQMNSTTSTGAGMSIYRNGFYPAIDSRSLRPSQGLRFSNLQIRRCRSSGLQIFAARDLLFQGVRIHGCRVGVVMRYLELDAGDSWTPHPIVDLENITFVNAEVSFNELYGFQITDAKNLIFTAVRANNNGQGNSHPSGSRVSGTISADAAGIYANASAVVGAEKSGWILTACEGNDDQTWTSAVSARAASPRVISAKDPAKFRAGQTIKLAGAGVAGVDLICRIDDIERDEITIDADISTFPAAAGTGTIAVNGKAVVGVGTAFLTELLGRYWITVGGQTLQIAQVDSNTSATLVTAAAPPIAAGSAFTICSITAQAMQCQKHGYQLPVSLLSPLLIGCRASGNVTADKNDLTAAASPARFVSFPSDEHWKLIRTADTAEGLELQNDVAGGNSPRLFFFNRVTSDCIAVYMNNGRLTIATGGTPAVASGTTRFQIDASGTLYLGGVTKVLAGAGTPEGAVSAPIGSLFLRTDGGAGTTLYIKESTAGNTGWVAK